VGDPLTVKDDDMGLFAYFSEGLYKYRGLPKREQAWDVGKVHGLCGQSLVNQYEIREGKDKDGCMDLPILRAIRSIGTGYGLDRLREGFLSNVPRKAFLNCHSFLIGQIPGME
jgi:hypothetical protein